MSELDELRRTLPMVGAEPSILDDTRIAHVVAHGHRILSRRTVPGLRVEMEETPDAIVGKLIVEAGAQIAQPIHMCFGLAHPTGVQQIKIDVHVLEGAQARGAVPLSLPLRAGGRTSDAGRHGNRTRRVADLY